MSLDATKPSPAPDAVAYYRRHRPEKNIARVGLTAWRSVLLEMIEDNLTLDEIHTWMTKHHKALQFQLPAKTTVRDWLTRVRQEIGKPLRQKAKSPESAIHPQPVEAPAAPATPPTKFPTAATTTATKPSKSPEPEPPSFPKTSDRESATPPASVTSDSARQKLPEPETRQNGEVDWTNAPASIPPPRKTKNSEYRSHWDKQFLARKKFLEEQRRRICEEIPNSHYRGQYLLAKVAETPKTNTTASDYAARIADLNAIYRTLPDASMGDLWVNTMSKTYVGFVEG
jgi:hypothetical protein